MLAQRRFLVVRQVVELVATLSDVLTVITAPQQAQKLAQAHPEIIIRPDIPADVSLFSGYGRAAELVAMGEQAAEAALPQIRELLQPRLHWPF
jgi:hypothetical protein